MPNKGPCLSRNAGSLARNLLLILSCSVLRTGIAAQDPPVFLRITGFSPSRAAEDHFGDPRYKYHAAMSQLCGVTALRVAQADFLPLDCEFYGDTVDQFLNRVEEEQALRVNQAEPRYSA